MRISTASIASALLALPLIAGQPSAAQAEDGKVYYKGGTIVETEDMQLKFNVQLQPRYGFFDYDSDREQEDVSEFNIRRARLQASGLLLDKQFSFVLQNDFASDSGGGDLKDAWIQWNYEPANLRFGQFKVPYTRQYNVSSSKLFFIERSDVVNIYDRDRDRGLMVHGALGEMAHYYAGVFNGEGSNERSDDTEHLWSAALDFVTPGYGSRGEEGDLNGGEFGATAGISGLYQQDEFEGEQFDTTALNADIGVRVAGFDAQAEAFFEEPDTDLGDNPQFWGFYAQATYSVEKLGFGLRYGFSDEDDVEDVEDLQEYSGVVNYFINGHGLKLQAQATFRDENLVGGESFTDLMFLTQLTGYF